jgi:hypothetical protein
MGVCTWVHIGVRGDFLDPLRTTEQLDIDRTAVIAGTRVIAQPLA